MNKFYDLLQMSSWIESGHFSFIIGYKIHKGTHLMGGPQEGGSPKLSNTFTITTKQDCLFWNNLNCKYLLSSFTTSDEVYKIGRLEGIKAWDDK
jgi:hypothetical protein